MLSNGLVATAIILWLEKYISSTQRTIYLLLLGFLLLFIMAFKFIFSMGYLLKFYIRSLLTYYTEETRSRNKRAGNLINEQIRRQLDLLRERYVRQTTEMLRKRDISNNTVAKIRLSRMSMNRK